MSTLTQYRIRVARALAGYEARGTLNQAGQRTATGGSVGTLTEARWPLLSPRVAQTYTFNGAYLLRPAAAAADKLRLVMAGGLNSQTGQLTPDADWAGAPTAGEAYELHSHEIEPLNELTDLLNAALKAIYLKVDVEFTPATDAKGAYVPTLDADGNPLAVWLTDEQQVLSLRSYAALAPYGAVNATWGAGPLRGAAYRAGDRLYLTLGGATVPTSTLFATVKKPAYFHCRATGADMYGSAAGLDATSETSEALPFAEWVADGAILAAWEQHRPALEAALERRRDRFLLEADVRFDAHQEAYFRANPATRTFLPAVAYALS